MVTDIEERLLGRTGKTLPVSVKGQVYALIKVLVQLYNSNSTRLHIRFDNVIIIGISLLQEASDIDNLCQMYIGWGPYL